MTMHLSPLSYGGAWVHERVHCAGFCRQLRAKPAAMNPAMNALVNQQVEELTHLPASTHRPAPAPPPGTSHPPSTSPRRSAPATRHMPLPRKTALAHAAGKQIVERKDRRRGAHRSCDDGDETRRLRHEGERTDEHEPEDAMRARHGEGCRKAHPDLPAERSRGQAARSSARYAACASAACDSCCSASTAAAATRNAAP